MFVGKYNSNYTAYVTHTGTYWDPVSKTTKTGTGTGATAAAARANFCARFGTTCSNGKKGCYGDPGCPAGNVSRSGSGNDYSKLGAKGVSVYTPQGKGNRLTPVAGPVASSGGGGGSGGTGSGSGSGGGCTPRPCPPPSNQTDIIGYWNQMSCHFGNLTCHQLPDWGFSVIAGLGGVLILGLLVRKRR